MKNRRNILAGFFQCVVWSLPLIYLVALNFTGCDAPDPTGPAASARITLTTTDDALPADGTSTTQISAYVLDPRGDPATGPIYWTTTCGILDKSSDTMADGASTVTLTAPNHPCDAVITADAVHAKASITINCYSVDAYQVTVSGNPSEIPADGYSTSTISAVVKDARGLFVPDGTEVQFSTTGGTLSAESATTASGRATVTLTSETVPKNVKVSATVGDVTGFTWVRFYSTQVGWIVLRANPERDIPCDGSSSSIITATVYDVNSNLVEDGSVVYFATTWGTLSASQAVTSKGVATVILYSQYDTENDQVAEVTAVSGDKSASVEVHFSRYQGTPSTPQPTSTSIPTHTPTPVTPTTTPTYTPTPPPSTPTEAPTDTPAPTAMAPVPPWLKRTG